jgi:CheY-like chemotaxis protein
MSAVAAGPVTTRETRESILVIDDEEVMRDVLGSLLSEAGYRVTLAKDGLEGMLLAKKGGFDAAIVDVMLPEMGGLEVLDDGRKSDGQRHGRLLRCGDAWAGVTASGGPAAGADYSAVSLGRGAA